MAQKPRQKRPASDRTRSPANAEAQFEKRAAKAGYTLTKDENGWYAEIHGTRWGPIATVDELDEFLPKG
jgi:hypothetical protein